MAKIRVHTGEGTVVEEVQTPSRDPSYERKSGNWVNAYMEYVKESESPDNFHIWIALSCLASVVRRKVFLSQGIYLLYPNLFVGLVGPPGRVAKSTAMHLGKRLIQVVDGVILGPNSCSREQLIRAMAGVKVDDSCAMTIFSSEFSSLVEVSGIPMIQFLMDIYDCDFTNPKGWSYDTKTQGKDLLVHPFLNLLFCTTPGYIADVMPDNITGHGFTSRVIYVYEDRERLVNSRPDEMNATLAGTLVNDLKHISTISGVFRWSKDGEDTYDTFYNSLYKPENIPEDRRIQGYHWRKRIHVLKVAMLLSLAENDSLILTARDIEAAVQLLHNLEKNLVKVFSAVGKYEHASDVEYIGNMIRQSQGLSVEDIFRRTYHLGTPEDIRRILAMLSTMQIIKLARNKDGQEFAFYIEDGELPWG